MPLLLFTYFFVEVLAFLGVAKLIGVGWAFLAIFGCMLLGGLVAAMSMRSMLTSASQGKESVGALAGDTALLIAGWAMCVVPGFVSTFFGLLMVLPPTRTLMRRGLTARVRRSLESFGEQLFDASPIAPKAQHRTSYGTFTPAPGQPGQPGGTTTHEVIDADELEQWYRMDGPDEDHGTGPSRGGVHWVPALLRFLLAALSGWLVYFSYEPHGYWAAGIAGTALFFLSLVPWPGEGRELPTARLGALLGFTHALTCYLFLLPWIGEFVGAMPYIALSVFLALYGILTGVLGVLAARLPCGYLGLPLLLVAVEFLRSSFPFGGFAWVRLAWGQINGPLANLAAWGGPALVTLAAALTAAGAVGALTTRGRGGRAAGVACLLLPLAAGAAAGQGVNLDSRTTGTVRAAAVQGNVPRLGLDFNAQRRAVLDNHAAETRRLAGEARADNRPLDLVFWPENASDVNPFTSAEAADIITSAVREVGAPTLVGTITRGEAGEHNTAVVFNPDGTAGDAHNKRFLQPFGEYMPMRDFFRHFSAMVDLAGDFKPGNDDGVVRMGGVRVGVAACYEVAEDAAYRMAVKGGAQLLTTPTNNATFGFADMTYQQLAMSRMRAIELDRAVVVVATSGISAMVHPDGTVSQHTGIFEAAHLVEELPLRETLTPAARFGAATEWALVLAGIVVALGAVVASRRGYAASGTRAR